MTETAQESNLYVPDPPPKLEACPDDIAALEAFVRRFGWHEFLWHVGQLLVKAHGEATGIRKGVFRALSNHINFIVPGAMWCDQELHIHRPDEQPTARCRIASIDPEHIAEPVRHVHKPTGSFKLFDKVRREHGPAVQGTE